MKTYYLETEIDSAYDQIKMVEMWCFLLLVLWDLILGICFIGTADIVEKYQLMCVLQPGRVDKSFKRHE